MFVCDCACGNKTFSLTYPKDNVVAEHEVFVATADLCIFISVIVHLLL